MNISRKLILVLPALILMCCEEVVYVSLDTMDPKLVVEASIDWEKGTTGNTQTIKLTTTTAYYDTIVPVVSGATVVITNSQSKVFNFTEVSETGEYVCTEFEPVAGETYSLTINYDGETYTSSETLTTCPELQDNIEQVNDGGFSGDEIEIRYYFQDNGSEENFYLSSVQAPFLKVPSYTLESDEYSQGNRMYLSFGHEDTAKEDLITIRLYGISKRYHDYMGRLLEAATDGDLLDATPAAVKGNLINQTNKDNYALGYFRLSEVSTKNYVVQ